VSEDARAAERVARSLRTAVETADLDLMGALWLEDDEVVCVHPGWPALHGRSPVMRSWAVVMAGAAYVQFFLTDISVSVDGDTAVVSCGESVLTGGEDVAEGFVSARAVATTVLRRTPAGWRVRLHHASPVIRPQQEDGERGDGRRIERGPEEPGRVDEGEGGS
jgi:ketosteroid isomerase-like protein